MQRQLLAFDDNRFPARLQCRQRARPSVGLRAMPVEHYGVIELVCGGSEHNAWEFEKEGKELRVRVDGQLVFNDSYAMIDAAASGYGIAYVPESIVERHIASGEHLQLLDNWPPPFGGYLLYYPSRRQNLPAFQAIVDALRHRS